MVNSVILLKVKKDQINELAEKILEIEGIREVFSAAGKYDMIVVAQVYNNYQLVDMVTNKILKIDGVHQTETLVAFKAYSQYELEQMFSIRFEE